MKKSLSLVPLATALSALVPTQGHASAPTPEATDGTSSQKPSSENELVANIATVVGEDLLGFSVQRTSSGELTAYHSSHYSHSSHSSHASHYSSRY